MNKKELILLFEEQQKMERQIFDIQSEIISEEENEVWKSKIRNDISILELDIEEAKKHRDDRIYLLSEEHE